MRKPLVEREHELLVIAERMFEGYGPHAESLNGISKSWPRQPPRLAGIRIGLS